MGETINNKYGYPVGPGCKALAIVTSDAANQLSGGLAKQSNAFQVYVGGTGAVAVICAEDSSAVTFAGVPAGTMLPVLVTRVLATGTTATNMLAIY